MKAEEVFAIKQAILMEIEGYEFYKMAQSQFPEPKVKEAFGELMNEERLHAKWLEEAYEKINDSPNSKKALSFLEAPPSAKVFDWANLMQKSAQSSLAVFGIALELEKSSMEHYLTQAKTTDIPELKTLFNILATWEKAHYDQFSDLYNQLKEDWWSNQGFSPF